MQISTDDKEQINVIINQILQKRKATRTLMTLIIMLPFLISLAVLITFWGDIITIISSSLFLVGIPAIAFVYTGKLQECDDLIRNFQIIVIISDDLKVIIEKSEMIRCYGEFEKLFDHIGKVIKYGQRRKP